MKRLFAPGCALNIDRPELADRMFRILKKSLGEVSRLNICCRNQPPLEPGSLVINVCPGCDRRFRTNDSGASTISLWEILVEHEFLPLPDYGGREMSILDACPTRDQVRVHEAVRTLISRMNITLIEPERTRTWSTCCGDSFYGALPVEEVLRQMQKRGLEMPVDDVIVYCVSCSKSMFNGGRRPRHMVDLLLEEETFPGTRDPDLWHAELDEFISRH